MAVNKNYSLNWVQRSKERCGQYYFLPSHNIKICGTVLHINKQSVNDTQLNMSLF
jgi:hypothetical protein